MSYLEEMSEQADVLESFFRTDQDQVFLCDVNQVKEYRKVLFTGMGSSCFAGYYGAILLNRRGIPAWVLEAGELEREFLSLLTEDTLLVALSQSGESPETLRCVEAVKGNRVLGITNRLDSSLAKICQYGVIDIRAGVEKTSATKSYTNTLAGLLRLIMVGWGYQMKDFEDQLSLCLGTMRDWLGRGEEIRDRLIGFFTGVISPFFLGSGISLTSARQAALVYGEMTHDLTTAQSIGQFFHGLIEQVREEYGVVFFHPGSGQDVQFDQAVGVLLDSGCRVVLVGSDHLLSRGSETRSSLVMGHGILARELAPLADILIAQCLAYETARKAGFTPGELTRVQKVY